MRGSGLKTLFVISMLTTFLLALRQYSLPTFLDSLPEGEYLISKTGCFIDNRFVEFKKSDYEYYHSSYFPILSVHMLDFDHVINMKLIVKSKTISMNISSPNCLLSTIDPVFINVRKELIVGNGVSFLRKPFNCSFSKTYKNGELMFSADFLKTYLPYRDSARGSIKIIKGKEEYQMLISPVYGNLLLEEEDEDYSAETSPLRSLGEPGESVSCKSGGKISWKLKKV